MRLAWLILLAGCSDNPLPLPRFEPVPSPAATLDLSMGADDLALPDLAAASLTIDPPQVRLGIGRGQVFTASRASSFQPDQGQLVTLDAQRCRYRAPDEPGTYHVIATAADGATATATITVVPLMLNLIAGALGGPGNADDTGSDARFSDVNGLELSADGSTLYVLDGSAIRVVDLASGAVHTLVGLPSVEGAVDGDAATARLCSPRELGSDGMGHLLAFERYSPCGGGSIIRSIDIATGAVSTIAHGLGVSGAGIAADGAGNVYFGDSAAMGGGATVKRLTLATGAITGLALVDANGTPRSDAPTDLVFSDGTLWMAENGASPILAINPTTGVVRPFQLFNYDPKSPGALEWWGHGPSAFYFTLSYEYQRLDLIAGSAQPTPPFAFGRSLFADPDYASVPVLLRGGDASGGVLAAVSRYEINELFAGAPTREVAGLTHAMARLGAVFHSPVAVAATPDGAYVLDQTSITLVNGASGDAGVLAGGVPLVFEGPPRDGVGTDALLSDPHGIAWDGGDGLYFCDVGTQGQSVLRKVSRSTGTVTTLPQTLPASCGGLAFDPSAKRIVLGAVGQPGVAELDPTSGDVTLTSTEIAPLGLAFSDGTLYAATTTGIFRREASGSWTPVFESSTDAGLSQYGPGGLAADGLGRLFVAADSTVKRFDLASGTLIDWVGQAQIHGVKTGPLPARLSRATGLAVDGNGDLLIVDQTENALLTVTPATP